MSRSTVPFDGAGYLNDSPVPPQVGLALWSAGVTLAARAAASTAAAGGGLPPIAKPYAHPAWLARLARCYAMVRDRLAVAAFPIARCTGEEFALHVTISAANTLAAKGLGPDLAKHGMALLPPLEVDDFAAAHRDLFADSLLLVLFDPLYDGIEDPTSPDNQRLGIGPYLHPSRWFDPFPGYERGAALERLELVEDVDDPVILAAAELALAAGARASLQIIQDGGEWLARARYPGRELVGVGPDPQSAATALARLILDGARCPSCGRPVITDPGAPHVEGCLWRRHDARWEPGCA